MESKKIEEQLQSQEEMLKRIYKSAEKTRKYFLWTLIMSLIVFIVPLIIFLIVLPHFIDTLTSGL